MPRGKPKAVNAPPKALSSYFLFAKDRRSQLAAEHKDKKITEISKLLAAEWKSMDSERKDKYIENAKKAKAKYAIEFDKYKETEDYKTFMKEMEEWNENHPKNGKASKGSKGKGSKSKGKAPKPVKKPVRPKETKFGAPKKPTTSYFIFTSEKRAEIVKNYPEKKVTEIAKMLGDEWKSLSEEEKNVYKEKAGKLKKIYEAEFAKWKETEKHGEFQVALDKYQKELKSFNKSQKGGSSKKSTKKESSSESSDSSSDSSGSSSESDSSSESSD